MAFYVRYYFSSYGLTIFSLGSARICLRRISIYNKIRRNIGWQEMEMYIANIRNVIGNKNVLMRPSMEFNRKKEVNVDKLDLVRVPPNYQPVIDR